MKVGQLVQVSFIEDEDKFWYFGVVVKEFDDRDLIRIANGKKLMYLHNDTKRDEFSSDNLKVTELKSNGEPVMAKKNIFGKYIFEPEN